MQVHVVASTYVGSLTDHEFDWRKQGQRNKKETLTYVYRLSL